MKFNFGKKLIIGAALLCLPFSAMALEALNDSELGGVTGQAGVSIALDNVVIYQKSIADVTYLDTDGIGNNAQGQPLGTVTQAGIQIKYADNMEKLITLKAILHGNDNGYGVDAISTKFGVEAGILKLAEADDLTAAIGGAGFNPTNGSTNNLTNGISPLTIDVGECQALSEGWTYNTAGIGGGVGGIAPGSKVAGVVIGLPTLEINTYYDKTIGETKTIKLVEATIDGADVINNDHDFITIKKTGNSTMAILGGRLEIAPH